MLSPQSLATLTPGNGPASQFHSLEAAAALAAATARYSAVSSHPGGSPLLGGQAPTPTSLVPSNGPASAAALPNTVSQMRHYDQLISQQTAAVAKLLGKRDMSEDVMKVLKMCRVARCVKLQEFISKLCLVYTFR